MMQEIEDLFTEGDEVPFNVFVMDNLFLSFLMISVVIHRSPRTF